MRLVSFALCILVTISLNAQDFPKVFKYSTFYAAVSGGNSVSDQSIYSVTQGLETSVLATPYDYNVALGVRKIARFGYENKANTFYDGSENSLSDAATLGKRDGFEFLVEVDWRRQVGVSYLDQHHFIRYVANKWVAKVEYLKEGFADVKYFESSQRYRYKINNKLSINIGAAQRLSEPYGYDPLAEWVLDNGDIHYMYLAIMEGYNVDVYANEYSDPSGNIVATSTEVWEEVVIPNILVTYTERKRNELPEIWNHSVVVGFDYYHYKKEFWIHSWGNVMPYHYDEGNEYSYHKYEGKQWLDYSGGLIFGYKVTKSLGVFVEGKYNRYWNRTWYDFKLGMNYVIF